MTIWIWTKLKLIQEYKEDYWASYQGQKYQGSETPN